MPTSIYTLSDPNSGEIRYVGKTTQALKLRRKSHWAQARWAKKLPQTHVARWVRTLTTPPIMKAIAIVEDALGAETEIAVIALYRCLGYRLANLTKGGDGQFGYKLTSEQREKRKGFRPYRFPKGYQMTPEDRLAQRAMMNGNKFRLGVPLSSEHKAKMIAGVRRASAIRRNGLIVGPDWEAMTPTIRSGRIKAAYLKHERRGWHRRRLANGLRNLGIQWAAIACYLKASNARSVLATASQYRTRWRESLPSVILGDTWSAFAAKKQPFCVNFPHSNQQG